MICAWNNPGGEHSNPLHILVWGIPWTEEPGRVAVHGVAKSGTQLSPNDPR